MWTKTRLLPIVHIIFSHDKIWSEVHYILACFKCPACANDDYLTVLISFYMFAISQPKYMLCVLKRNAIRIHSYTYAADVKEDIFQDNNIGTIRVNLQTIHQRHFAKNEHLYPSKPSIFMYSITLQLYPVHCVHTQVGLRM